MATEHEVDRMVVRLIGDQSNYQKMLKDVDKQTEESAKWAETQGSKITKAFNNAFKSAQGMMSSVGSTMQKTGAASLGASTAISAPLGKAALDFSEYGKDINKLVKEFENSAKKAAEMKKGIMENTKAYEELDKIVKLTHEEISTFKVMSERTGLSIETLVKTVTTGSKEFGVWRKEAEKMGLVLGKDQVKSANDLAESWTRVKQSMHGMWTQVGAVVADSWKEWNDLIIGTISWTTKWVKENKALIQTVADLGMKLMWVGGALVTVGTVLTTISTFLGPIAAMVAAGAAAWLAWDTATGKFLKGNAMQIWGRYEESIMSAFNTTMAYGKRIIVYTNEVMTGVYDAIKAGNLELAVQILWSGVKVAWITALTELDKITGERFSAIFQNLAAGNWKSATEAGLNEIIILWTKMLAEIDPIFVQIQNIAASTWTEVVNSLDTAWVTILNKLDTVWVEIQNIAGKIGAIFQDAASTVMTAWTFVSTFFEIQTTAFTIAWKMAFYSVLGVSNFFVSQLMGILGTVATSIEKLMSGFGGTLATRITLPITLAMDAYKALTKTDSGVDMEALQSGLEKAGDLTALGDNIPLFGMGPEVAKALMASTMADAEAQAEVETTSAQDVERTRAQGRDIRLENRTEGREGALESRTGTRSFDTDLANMRREMDLTDRQAGYAREIADLEERRNELITQGQADAAKALETQQATLQASLDQVKAESEKMEAARANSDITARNAEETLRFQEQSLRIDQQKQAIIEKFDPVQKYMRQLKELNQLFKDGERDSIPYKKQLKEIREELAKSSFKVNVEFGLTGMDAVRKGAREEQELIENTLAKLGEKKAEEEALAEVERRQAEFSPDKQAAIEEQQKLDELIIGQQGAPGATKPGQDFMNQYFPDSTTPENLPEWITGKPKPKQDPMNPEQFMAQGGALGGIGGKVISAQLERIAVSNEKIADKKSVEMEPLGVTP